MFRDVLAVALAIFCVLYLPGWLISYNTIGQLDFEEETGASIIGYCEFWLNSSTPQWQSDKLATSIHQILLSWLRGYVCVFKSCGYGFWISLLQQKEPGYDYFVTMENGLGEKILLKLESSFTLPWYMIQRGWGFI